MNMSERALWMWSMSSVKKTSGMQALVVLKTKQRNRLDVENDLRCALSSFNHRIHDLVRKKQQHLSH
ncbi:hypothetical protein FHG87_025220 [Trinorchestia longiramus]|nr:hypothetical protein FHG87_025220 [Trinorchestia longiramus]